jgi:hypothetical protein
MFAKPFSSNGCFLWLQNYDFKQTCHIIYRGAKIMTTDALFLYIDLHETVKHNGKKSESETTNKFFTPANFVTFNTKLFFSTQSPYKNMKQ